VLAELDRRIVVRGAASALVLATPAAVASSLLAGGDQDHGGLLSALSFVVLVAFVFGGFVAGMESHQLPAKHGAAAAGLAFVVVQLLGAFSRVTRGDDLSPVRIVLGALLAASAGIIGGLLAARRQGRPS
jgi:hypothetical protein